MFAVAASVFAGLAPPVGAEATPVLVVEGRGFGHGVGMPQDGAYAMAMAGSSAAAILDHFYPGTAISRRVATVQVGVFDGPGTVAVVLPSGGEVRDAVSGPQSPGFPITVNPGGSVSISVEGGKHKATPGAGAALTRPAAAPAPPPTPPPAAATPTTVGQSTATTSLLDPLLHALVPTTAPATTVPATAPAAGLAPEQNFALSARALSAVPRGEGTVALPATGRSYRGLIHAAVAGRGLQLTNEVDVEQYLRGLGEMPASWPAAALQAQAIAARTFAVRAAAAGRTLCDTQQCQVYIGAGNEHATTSAAAVATRGQVLTFKGALAEAVYSASAGGVTATAEEGFGPGSPDLPYLRPVAYAVDDPQVWALSLPLQQAGARLGYRGTVTDVRVTRTGPSGRPLEITFEGANGPMAVGGHRFWAEFSLRSTLFTLRTDDLGALPVGELTTGVSEAVPTGIGRLGPAVPGRGITAATVEPLGRAPLVGLVALVLAGWGAAAGGRRARRPRG